MCDCYVSFDIIINYNILSTANEQNRIKKIYFPVNKESPTKLKTSCLEKRPIVSIYFPKKFITLSLPM